VRWRPTSLLLIATAAGAFALHAHRAEHPTSGYQSADERSYGILAINLAEHGDYDGGSTGMRDPLHWPPGAPALFAAGHKLFGNEASERTFDLPSAYWLQGIISVGSVLAAFGLAGALAGPWAGVLAAALVASYPPLILATGEQLSEPLGAFMLALAFVVLARGGERRSALWYAVAGALLGLSVLTRADLLLVPILVALVAAVWQLRVGRGLPQGARVGGLIVAGALVPLGPWFVYASARAGELVPVTRGGPSALFVGTYLPGGGTTTGMKRDLADDVYRRRPRARGTPALELDTRYVLQVAIASRHPDLPFHEAVAREARRNLVRYGLDEPLDFGWMMLEKAGRLWTRYARGGARHTSTPIRIWHVALVLGALGGLLAGLRRRPSLSLAAVLLTAVYLTAVHALMVSQGRYNLPLMPTLLAAGVAGWTLWWRARAERARSE
jgi:hypothetical protein